MRDFAELLLEARNRVGLTQAQVAQAAGLTPSYLSFIENRKKPPPSDEVCRRLAAVLRVPEKKVLEVAHMQRAPELLRKRVRTLTHSLKRERRSRRKALESLLSPFLFRGPPGFLEGALDRIGISRTRQKRIRQVMAAVGRHNLDQEKQISKIVDELPERERTLLLELLPELLRRERAGAQEAAAKTGRTAQTRPHTASRAKADTGPELLYDAPSPENLPDGPYLLEADADAATGVGEVQPGDRLVVDPAVRPGPGDLVVVRGDQGYRLRRLEADGDAFRLGRDHLEAHALFARIAQVGAGTVVEIRRPLRRRPEPYGDD